MGLISAQLPFKPTLDGFAEKAPLDMGPIMNGRELARRLSLDSRKGHGRWQRPTGLKLPEWALETAAKGQASNVCSAPTIQTTLPKPGGDVVNSGVVKADGNRAIVREGNQQIAVEMITSPTTPQSVDTCKSIELGLVRDKSCPGCSELSPLEPPGGKRLQRNCWRRLSLSESSKPGRNMWRRMSLNEKRRPNSLSSSSDLNLTPESSGTPLASCSEDERVALPKVFTFRRQSLRRREPTVPPTVDEGNVQKHNTPRRWRGPVLLQNDAVYEGEATDVPNGSGALLTPSFAYMGEWKDGVQHGYGVYVCLVSKCRYEGYFVNGGASEYGRLLLLSAGPTYVYGKFVKGKFMPRPSSATHDRNEAVKCASRARFAAESALAQACYPTKAAFQQLTREMATWPKSSEKLPARVNTESLPLVYPGPLTHMMALKTVVVNTQSQSPT